MDSILVALRYDDPSLVSDWGLEERILHILQRHQIPLTMAVVPFHTSGKEVQSVDPVSLAHIREAFRTGSIEVALHGFSHTMNSTDWVGRPSEFYGLPEAQQLALISEGTRALSDAFGAPIVGFVPPWNSYDGSTISALKKLGFRYLSASAETPTPCADTLTIIPKTCNLTELIEAVRCARDYRSLNPTVLGVFHGYDFEGVEGRAPRIDLNSFEKIIRWLSEQSDIRCVRINEAGERLDNRRSLKALRVSKSMRGLHWRINQWWPSKFHHSRPMACFFLQAMKNCVFRGKLSEASGSSGPSSR